MSKISTYDGTKRFYQPMKHRQKWTWKDCTIEKLQDSVQLQTMSALHDQNTIRNNGQPSYES